MRFPKTIKCTECEGKCIRVFAKSTRAGYQCVKCLSDFSREASR